MNQKLLRLYDKIERQRETLFQSLQHLPLEKLNSGSNGKWSINQIIAHLIAAENLSVSYVNKKILGVEDTANTGVREELKMILLIISQRLPFKFKAPKAVVDQTSQVNDFGILMEQWGKTRLELKALLDRVDERHNNRKIYRHVRVGMMNIKHALKFFREHVNHHTPQIKRLL